MLLLCLPSTSNFYRPFLLLILQVLKSLCGKHCLKAMLRECYPRSLGKPQSKLPIYNQLIQIVLKESHTKFLKYYFNLIVSEFQIWQTRQSSFPYFKETINGMLANKIKYSQDSLIFHSNSTRVKT